MVVLCACATASHVLPVFSGEWYTQATYQVTDDGCLRGNYSYENEKSGSAKEVASVLLENVSKRPDCEWRDAKCIYKTTSNPPDDFIGSAADWIIISNDIGIQTWGRDCVSVKGDVLDNSYVTIQPKYICPEGSRYTLKPTVNIDGCEIQPDTCLGDVAGRRLRLGDNTTVLGHVGITGIEDYVLEVLDNDSVVNLDDFEQFKSKSMGGFWGEKYDLKNVKALTYLQGMQIFEAGTKQALYNPKYTLSWNWHPGNDAFHFRWDTSKKIWHQIYSARNALFRCDSFVYYCYLAGANLHIVPKFRFPVNPKTIYSQFQSERKPVGGKVKDQSRNILTGNNYVIVKATSALIFAVFDHKKFDISQVDLATYAYVHNGRIPKQEKINTLWDIANQYQSDPEKFDYTIDILKALKPFTLIPSIVSLYHQQSIEKNKQALLSLLNEVIIFYKKPVGVMEAYDSNAKLAQKLIANVLRTTKEIKTLEVAYTVYANLASPEDALAILPFVTTKINANKSQTYFNSDLERLRIIFSTNQMQAKYLPKMLQEAKRYNTDHKVNFFHALCFIMSDLPKHFIDPQLLKSIKVSLELNKPLLKNSLNDIRTPFCDYNQAISVQ